MLYKFFVKDESAAKVCVNELRIPESEFPTKNSQKFAWRKLSNIYNRFGFPRKYDQSAYQKMDEGRLLQFVRTYWENGAKEAQMLAFFPEIQKDYLEAKREKENNPSSWSSGSGRGIEDRQSEDEDFQYRNSYENDADVYYDPNTQSTGGSEGINIIDTAGYSQTPQSGSSVNMRDATATGAAFIGGLVLLLVVCYIFRKPLGNILHYIFWGLELLCFYGGIIYCIILLVKKRPKIFLLLGLSSIILGIGFGCLEGGKWISGLICLGIAAVVYVVFTAARNR